MIIDRGDRVRVSIPEDALVPDRMRDYNGQDFMVIKTSSCKSHLSGYCVLDGAVSDLGGQYTFMNEWLTKL